MAVKVLTVDKRGEILKLYQKNGIGTGEIM
jgi:hypothetical protein